MAICQSDTILANGGGYMKEGMSNRIITVSTWAGNHSEIISLNYIAIGI